MPKVIVMVSRSSKMARQPSIQLGLSAVSAIVM